MKKIKKMPYEELEYIVEDEILAEILGRQNFSNKESAVLEIVKNAYDAGATEMSIELKKNGSDMQMIIIDNGSGMDEQDIKNSWMHVGKSTRGYSDPKNDRIYAGSKGIGRFALSRLGEDVEILTCKDKCASVKWKTDWLKSYLYTNVGKMKIGTKITIGKLRDKWNKRTMSMLMDYLSRVYNDDKMKVKSIIGKDVQKLENLWTEPIMGLNCTSSISIKYIANEQKLSINIKSDEFKDSVESSIGIPTKGKKIIIDIYEYLSNKIISLIEKEDLVDGDIDEKICRDVLKEVGDFSGDLYFSLKNVTNIDYEKFQYKYKNITERYKENIILYRNSFSIDSFEGRKDWLSLAKRAAISPAAASHVTGSWRVRAAQISGYIEIDKAKNSEIEDLSNRQGIVENIYFKIFKEIILSGISEFERFRQEIIRKISELTLKETKENDNTAEREEAQKTANKIRRNYENIKKLTPVEISNLIKEFDRREKEKTNAKKEKEEVEQKARYEAQLLNVLATSQLKVNALGHEIKNNRNIIEATPDDLEQAIKKRLEWENLKNEGTPKYDNIPVLLNDLRTNSEALLKLTDVILEEIEKSKFKKDRYLLAEIIDDIVSKWQHQYNWIDFSINSDSEEIYISYDQLMVVLDNLILNSIQQNEQAEKLNIDIVTQVEGERIYIEYRDSGIGLHKRYADNPFVILEPHETTRSKGHGLGMWIVNNTVNKLDGKVENIRTGKGFKINFYITVEKVG